MKTIRLREGKERSLQRRHPWIFESAIAKGGGDAGETVRVESAGGDFLGWASFSPKSKIRARIWTFDETQRIDATFFEGTLKRALQARSRFDIQSNGVRLVHGESDGLPGLIVDRYGDTLVAQFLSSGAERWKDVIADALLAQTGLSRLYERSDASARALEGLPKSPAGCVATARPTWCCKSMTGNWPSILQRATRPAFTWISVTAASVLPTTRGACSFSACSIATATPAALLWPPCRVVRRRSPPSIRPAPPSRRRVLTWP